MCDAEMQDHNWMSETCMSTHASDSHRLTSSSINCPQSSPSFTASVRGDYRCAPTASSSGPLLAFLCL